MIRAGDPLIFYYSKGFYKSDMALMALYESKKDFIKRPIDGYKLENIRTNYLLINPTGELPTLVTDEGSFSSELEIVSYLSRCEPLGGVIYQEKMMYLAEQLASLQIDVITVGSFMFPHLTIQPKISAEEKKKHLRVVIEKGKIVDEVYENHPGFRLECDAIRADIADFSMAIHDGIHIRNLLIDVGDVLNVMNQELKGTPWVCGDAFTYADVMLAVILRYLDYYGFSDRFWGSGRRKYLAKFFTRVQERKSFQKVFGKTTTKVPAYALAFAALILVAAVTYGYFRDS